MRITMYKSYLNESNQNYLIKERSTNYSALSNLSNPEKVYITMKDIFHMHKLAEEEVYLISINSKCVPSAFFLLSKGTVNFAAISVREIFIQALLSSAVKIVLCHNHPSQDVTPSKHDIAMTEKIKEAGLLMDIPLADHIIIGAESYFSFAETGLL